MVFSRRGQKRRIRKKGAFEAPFLTADGLQSVLQSVEDGYLEEVQHTREVTEARLYRGRKSLEFVDIDSAFLGIKLPSQEVCYCLHALSLNYTKRPESIPAKARIPCSSLSDEKVLHRPPPPRPEDFKLYYNFKFLSRKKGNVQAHIGHLKIRNENSSRSICLIFFKFSSKIY